MRNSMTGFKASIVVIITLMVPGLVRAQTNRTWVSGVGDDVNPNCSRTAPCKTFPGAMTRTNMGGEISCIDSGTFGVVVINKSLTIDTTSCSPVVVSPATNGITVNITAGADTAKTVRIRGLSLNGIGTGINGIKVVAAASVYIEDVVIDGFTNHGIQVEAPVGTVFVKNTTIRNVVKSGINVEPSASAVGPVLWIERTSLLNSFTGLSVGNGVRATIRDSDIIRHKTGVLAEKGELNVVNCLFTANSAAVMARGGSVIRLSFATVIHNDAGLVPLDGGKIISFRNNVVHGNGQDGAPTQSVPPV